MCRWNEVDSLLSLVQLIPQGLSPRLNLGRVCYNVHNVIPAETGQGTTALGCPEFGIHSCDKCSRLPLLSCDSVVPYKESLRFSMYGIRHPCQPASYLMAAEALSPVEKWLHREADHSPHLGPRLSMLCLHFLLRLHGVVLEERNTFSRTI
jgi:hypothetical protein